MLYVYIIISIAVGGGLLSLVSETFAYEVSRVMELAFERVEYRLALRQARRVETGEGRRLSRRGAGLGYGVSYLPRA